MYLAGELVVAELSERRDDADGYYNNREVDEE